MFPGGIPPCPLVAGPLGALEGTPTAYITVTVTSPSYKTPPIPPMCYGVDALLQPSTTCHRHRCHHPNQSPLEPPLNGYKTNNWLSCAIPPFAVIQHRMWLLCLQDLKTARSHNKAGGMISIWVNGCHRIFLDVICALTV